MFSSYLLLLFFLYILYSFLYTYITYNKNPVSSIQYTAIHLYSYHYSYIYIIIYGSLTTPFYCVYQTEILLFDWPVCTQIT